jgi:CubicO group peptidase (beta-lactamase class C family)
MKRRLFMSAGLSLVLLLPAAAADLSIAAPDSVGLGRLERATQFFRQDTASKRLPGVVVMIARNGQIAYQEAFGVRDPETGAPMQKDSIFRLQSMTKPITAVAVLMLMEEGKIRLSDPIAKYLPALKDVKVLVEQVDASGHRRSAIVPSDRAITIQQLMTHTSGITYGTGNSAQEQLTAQAGIGLFATFKPEVYTALTDQQMVDKIAKLPLMFQPGTAWAYGWSSDVLLAMIEVVSGMRADQFFEQRIFQPLGLTDTFFNVPKDKLDRVAQPGPDPDTGETPQLADVALTRTFLSGGGGLLSTASDYMRFAMMLANGGQLDGVRLLSRKTVELMTSDDIGPALAQGPGYFPGPGTGWGMGVDVRTAPGLSPLPGSVGLYGWGGYAGTLFFIDPNEKLVAVMMIQSPGQRVYYQSTFRSLVYQALN